MRPMIGQGVCKMHGGKQGAARANGERKATQAEASAIVARLLHDTNAKPVTDPVSELQAIAGRMASAVESLGERVNALPTIDYEDLNATRRAHVVVEAWQQLMVEYRKALTDMVRLGLEERRVALTEQAGALLAGVVERVAAALLTAALSSLADHADAAAVLRATWAQTSAEIGRRELLAAIEAGPAQEDR